MKTDQSDEHFSQTMASHYNYYNFVYLYWKEIEKIKHVARVYIHIQLVIYHPAWAGYAAPRVELASQDGNLHKNKEDIYHCSRQISLQEGLNISSWHFK